jgi:hypothetical protein
MSKTDQNKIATMLGRARALQSDSLAEWKGFARNALADSGNVSTGEFKALMEGFITLIEAVETSDLVENTSGVGHA